MPLLPLSGIRILDLSRLLPGPLATLMLSDFGAEVVRVEDPGNGDYVRHLPPLCDDGMGVLFHALNRGKKSITLDLKTNEGLQNFKRLLANADVLVESFRPGVLKKLGLSPELLREQFPRLIICSISGYGQNSPMATRAGHDLNFVAQSGILGAMANPSPLPVPIGDIAGGSWPAALQILAALLSRQQHNQGCWIDVAMTSFTSSLMLLEWSKALAQEKPDLPFPDPLLGDQPCYGIYATRDGHIAVAALEHKFWKKLVDALGLPHLIDRAMVARDEALTVKRELQTVLSEKTTLEWQAILDPLDVCVEPVQSIQELSKQTSMSFLHLVDIGGHQTTIPSIPLCQTITSVSTKCAPQLGENNSEFL